MAPLSLRSLNLPIHSRRAKKILFRGLDSAGKTTLLHMLKDEHLKLSGRSYQAGVLNLDALVDGLLRSCRLETLSIAEAPDIGTKLVKVLCEKLVSQKSRQHCCGSSPVSCWLHCLKDVKIALFFGTDKKALDCHYLLQALPTLTRHHHISFNFRW